MACEQEFQDVVNDLAATKTAADQVKAAADQLTESLNAYKACLGNPALGQNGIAAISDAVQGVFAGIAALEAALGQSGPGGI